MNSPSDSKRKYYIDVLRCLACLAVVMLHAASPFAQGNFGTLGYFAGHFTDSSVRFAVPVFVMISGSLLLDENYECSFRKIVRHIVKFAIFFVSWTILYTLAHQVIIPLLSHGTVSFRGILSYMAHGVTHLWFIPMIAGLYLITPVLRLWVKKENVKSVKYFLLLSFVFAFAVPQIMTTAGLFVPQINSVTFFDYMNFKFVMGYTPYFILGWYLSNYEIKNLKAVAILGIAGLLFTVSGGILLSYFSGQTVTEEIYNNFTLNVLFYSVMIFCIFKKLFDNRSASGFPGKAVKIISSNSLGIYAMHAFLLSILRNLPFFDSLNPIIAISGSFLIAFSLSLLASVIMKKIPIVKEIV